VFNERAVTVFPDALVLQVGDFYIVVPDVCMWFGSSILTRQLAVRRLLAVNSGSAGEFLLMQAVLLTIASGLDKVVRLSINTGNHFMPNHSFKCPKLVPAHAARNVRNPEADLFKDRLSL
jgi:hypothetical protein